MFPMVFVFCYSKIYCRMNVSNQILSMNHASATVSTSFTDMVKTVERHEKVKINIIKLHKNSNVKIRNMKTQYSSYSSSYSWGLDQATFCFSLVCLPFLVSLNRYCWSGRFVGAIAVCGGSRVFNFPWMDSSHLIWLSAGAAWATKLTYWSGSEE